jgi:hypothetical protein
VTGGPAENRRASPGAWTPRPTGQPENSDRQECRVPGAADPDRRDGAPGRELGDGVERVHAPQRPDVEREPDHRQVGQGRHGAGQRRGARVEGRPRVLVGGEAQPPAI